MVWEEPRTWEPGERNTGIDWGPILNQHIAGNQQFLFDTYTDVRGQYKDLATVTLQSSWASIVNLTLTTRHEAILLTIVGQFPSGARVRYSIATNPTLEILNLTKASSVAKQWIIPSLSAGQEYTVDIAGIGPGQVNSFQADIRELT